jgi:transposase
MDALNINRMMLSSTSFDGSGLCQFYKRLDRGTFKVPAPHGPNAVSVSLSERELDDLLDGINLEPDKPPRRPRRSRIH